MTYLYMPDREKIGQQMNVKLSFLGHFAFSLILLTFSLIGVGVDKITTVNRHELLVRTDKGDVDLRISGLELTSSDIVLKYHKCAKDSDDVAEYRLYEERGVQFGQLREGGTRNPSIAQFAHVNIDEEGTEIIGDIDLLPTRATGARFSLYMSISLQGLAFLLLVFLRRAPTSVISKCPEGESRKMHILGQVHNGLLIMGGVAMWWAIILYSTIVTVLLPHLFREARDRCDTKFSSIFNAHYEMRTLGIYVREHAILNGASIILFGCTVLAIYLYMLGMFLHANSRTINMQSLTSYQLRGLSWYAKVWGWHISILVLVFAIFLSFWVASLTRVRGYDLNMFYWMNGSKVSQETGFSRTGTLLDVVQGFVPLFTLAPAIVYLTVYAWVLFIPALAMACSRQMIVLAKCAQDVGVLLIIKALISWVTVAPTSLSMLERPECFDKPDFDDEVTWSWMFRFSHIDSCNDTMFSLHAVLVMVPAIVLSYFVVFGGIVRGNSVWMVTAGIFISALLTGFLVVTARYQYSADIHIGVCVVVCYLFSQSSAYRLLFREDINARTPPNSILSDKVIPTLSECVFRMETYILASKGLAGLKASVDEIEDIGLLYRTMGQAMRTARKGGSRPVAEPPSEASAPLAITNN